MTQQETWRCTNKRRERNGNEVECSDVGTWTLDKAHKTWRPSKPDDKSRRCWAHGPGADVKPHGRQRRAVANQRVNLAGGLLMALAPEVTKALEEIVHELSLLGFPGSSNRGSSYIDALDPVAGDAVKIAALTGYREDLRDWIADIEQRVDAGILLVARVLKVNHAHGVKLCGENQQGRQGSIVWGDPNCVRIPDKHNLCAACYMREYRWLAANGKPTREEPAA